MRITFKTLKFKNFKSYGNTLSEINLSDGGTNLIVGTNGMGKSSIQESLYFNLFGKAIGKIKKADIINNKNKKQLYTELDFIANGKDYKVIRGIKPDTFEIYENGKLIDQESSVALYQKRLMDIIKIDEKTFLQMILLNSKYSKFLDLSAPERRSLVESILSLDLLSELNVKLKDLTSKVNKSFQDTTNSLNTLNNRIEDYSSIIDKTQLILDSKKLKENMRDEEIKQIESRLVSLRETEVELKASLEQCKTDNADIIDTDINTIREAVNVLNERKQKGNTILATKNSEKSMLVKQNDFLANNETCPTCHQVIDTNYKDNILSKNTSDIQTLTGDIQKVNDRLEDINKETEINIELTRKIESFNSTQRTIQTKITLQEQSIISVINEIETLKSANNSDNTEEASIAEYKEKVAQYNLEAENYKKTKVELQEKIDIMKKMSAYLSDKGIKATIINKYVDIINERTNYYVNKLGLDCVFELNSVFDDKIVREGRETNYNSLSFGQKQRIDLSLLLSWLYIGKINNSVSTNLIFVDEILDAGLDNEGVENLLKILNEQENLNIFIISHRNLKEEYFDNVFQIVQNSQGFSEITKL
jgi:DNA repair exonuclease SbcCD ATPase subunit